MSTCKVDNQGRVVIPSKWRERQGIRAGSELIALEEDGCLILQTRRQAIREAQELVRLTTRPGSLTKALARERREQSDRETTRLKRASRPHGRPNRRNG
jgi:AbrB family looped-hinge helix DNA binding protein